MTGTLSFEGWQRRFVQANGLRLSYLEWGNPVSPTLLLLHGLILEAHCWDTVAVRLQDRLHLIAVDFRGHGESGWPAPPSYGTEDFVQDIEALAGALGLARCAVAGHSLGATIGIALAIKRPDLVDRLVVLESAPLGGSERAAPPWAALPVYDSYEELQQAMARVFPQADPAFVAYLAAHNARELPDGRWTRRHAADLQELRLAELWPEVSKIACPTLVAHGDLSTVFPLETAQRLAEAVPDARLAIVPGAGHPVAQDQPEAVETLLRRFLRDR